MEICEAINNQTHKLLSPGVKSSQLMFFCKRKSRNILTTLATQTEKRVLCQLSIEDIDKKSEDVLLNKKGKAIKLLLHHFFEQAL